MVGQVIRAVEAPISLSIGVARRGVALAGRVAGWAVTGIVRELSPDKGKEEPAPAAAEHPAEAAATLAGADAQPALSVAPEAEGVPSGGEAESRGVRDEGAEPALAGSADAEPPPVGGQDGAVVEHEPGIGTSVRAREPHSALNNPVTEPDMTEWPDPYDHREDPRDPGEDMLFGGDAGHTQTGATSTSEPHPSHDPEAEPWEGPKRDKVDQ